MKMKRHKDLLCEAEQRILEKLLPDIVEMIVWDCAAPEEEWIRGQLETLIEKRIRHIFSAELAAFQVRLVHTLAIDLHLPTHVNLYGNRPYIPDDRAGQERLVEEWFHQLKSIQ